MEYCRQTSESEYVLPNGKNVKFSPLTLKKWYQKYTAGGLEALIPHVRIDLGQSRALSEDVCRQADTTVGPTIVADGKHRQTYLIAFIDDSSRLLVQGEFFFEENAINMQKTFQKAILKFGVPKRIFADNGCNGFPVQYGL